MLRTMRIDVIPSPDSSPGEILEPGLLAERYGIGAVWTSIYPSSRDPFISFLSARQQAVAEARRLIGEQLVPALQ